MGRTSAVSAVSSATEISNSCRLETLKIEHAINRGCHMLRNVFEHSGILLDGVLRLPIVKRQRQQAMQST